MQEVLDAMNNILLPMNRAYARCFHSIPTLNTMEERQKRRYVSSSSSRSSNSNSSIVVVMVVV